MACVLASLLLFAYLLLLPGLSSSHPLCTDSKAPVTPKTPLAFCPYSGNVCCDSAKDLELQKQFQAMNISDPACSSILKSIVCSICDQFSAELFQIEGPQPVPVLCNSTISANASQSNGATNDFCGKVWDTCQNISILNSPFAPSLQGRAGVPGNSTYSKMTDLWQSKSEFCNAFGGDSGNGSMCFDGEPISLNNTETPSPPNGLCLEKIGNGSSYLNLVAHPDGSSRIFLSDQQGKIWLATVPDEDSGKTLELDELNPFVDLTDEVYFSSEFGLMGMAFHPNFAQNGRFFVSFNCDKIKWPGCSGRCSCNSDVNCDPSKLASNNGASPCQYHSVISEFTANGTTSEVSLATRANPTEVRRIFTMGLPFTSHHAGQILFGPTDGYLYFMMGDGGSTGDTYNFSQNKKSLLGKIMRLDVDNIPSAKEIDTLGLWGNYSIPKDNPFSEDTELQPEIWALGLRNPWRCSFDSERPSYFLCADVGQDQYEEVDIITKGGNYGWRAYEGPYLYSPPLSPGGNTSVNSTNPIFPIMGYNHSTVNKKEGSASITGGYFYRSMTDPCTYGSYLYADLYAGNMWAGIETPQDSGNFSSRSISFSCARDSPIQCESLPGSSLPALGYIFSFGEDNKKDVYLLTSKGVYRVVRPSRCSYACSKENATAAGSPNRGTSTPSSGSWLRVAFNNVMLFLSSSLLLILGFVF
ncbi:PREDICTED: HIPL1 protein-like isoform X1 [Nelumbo nucifera]|uniref:HIPL1 protein-like isoform X1 n=1 Tax=Nelumbo nucifera TaxID=4432 RepID=A0A1U7ZR40_NELNU|nr:PREDICTED: HIPL1 protein-like isoform X1 [Nelumbo nucifera]